MKWEQVTEYWQGLQPRERIALAIGGVAVLFAMFYFLLWQPLMNARVEMQREVQQQRELLQWMRNAAAEAKVLRGTSAPSGGKKRLGGQSLLSLVDSTAKRQGLGNAMKRLEPDGGEVRVWFEGAAFDRLAGWLQVLARENGVRVISATVERSDVPGGVDARLRLGEGEK